MQNSVLSKSLWQLLSSQTKAKKSPDIKRSTSGFTLIELLVVVIIVGVLSAIAAPSWLAFVNRQRINAATNTVFTALRSAQSQAKKENQPKTVTIDITNGKVTVPGTTQESLDSKIKITAVTENNPGTTIISSGTATILFDEKGTPFKLNTTYNPPVRTKAVSPIQIKLKQDLSGSEQCVTIRTLIGAIDTKCPL
jgi:prepilin-type N-terminal cleavage/methylation domain-containing protein